MELVNKIKSEIDSAVESFGTYTLMDKGIHEVMEVDPWLAELRRLPADEAISILKGVLGHRFGRYFVSGILSCIDDVEEGTDPWVDALFADDVIAYHY